MEPNQLCHWRQAIEAIDLVAADSRQRLNQLYTEMVMQLSQEFHSASFAAAAPSFDQKRATESADPSTDIDRLWELASHHPGGVANNSIWTLLLLSGDGLMGKDDYIDEDQIYPLAQVEGLWLDVKRRYPEDYYDKLLLSYTALLPLSKHPFREHALIRALYEAGDTLSAADLKFLESQTNKLDYGSEMLQPVWEALQSPSEVEYSLPGALQAERIDDVLLSLSPVFVNDEELFDLMFRRHWGHQSAFLDASPVADQLLSLAKTQLVKRGIRVDTDTLLPAEIYERLSRHRNSGPQSEVASCLHTPAEVFEELAQSTSKEIIYPLACNPMTPVSVLQQLMHWSGWGAKTVQRYVQDNPAYVGGETWQLMEMGRLQLQTDQRKKDVLLACLDLLASEPDPLDSLRILLNASLWASWRLEPSTLRLRMIQKGWASDELMQAAAWSWHWMERLAVASSPLAPATALAKLQGDGLPFIRHAALQPRRSVSALTAGGWMEQLAALATADPVGCVRHPRFADWLDQQPDLVASLLRKQHRTILEAGNLPAAYFCWQLSHLSEREQLRLLMNRQVPQEALDQLVRYDALSDILVCPLPDNEQGNLADLVASTAASHHQQTRTELLRCSQAELEKETWAELEPHEMAFFVMGFYDPADVRLLHTIELLKLLLHPGISIDLRRHLGQALDDRKDERHEIVKGYFPGYALNKAADGYTFIDGSDHGLNHLRITGKSLGQDGISDGLRSWLIQLVADHAGQVFVDGYRNEYLKTPVEVWPGVLSAKETKKLISSRNVNQRLVAACFGVLNDAQMEALASDPREEVRFALALLRPCPAPILEKLSADPNNLLSKAAVQNPSCRVSTFRALQGRSPLRNPNLPEEAARGLLKRLAREKLFHHATEILCWSPSLMQEILNSLDSEELRIFVRGLDWGSRFAPFRARPYSPELLSWMAQLPTDSNPDLSALRQLAASHPGTPVTVLQKLVKDPDRELRESVASNPACTTDLHQTLKQQGISGDTLAVVSSPHYPVGWLAEHASDQNPDLRAMVSRHPHCPLSLLIQLLVDQEKTSDYGPFSKRTVAEVAATSPALSTITDPSSYETAALALLRSTKPSSRARRLALRSRHCPPPLLRRCATSLDWRERHAVASHPATPPRQRKALLQDANQHVAQAAMQRCSETPS
ncbi:hypothetical protein H8F24_17450 [Synechococcus sp. CBW1002]|uniref:hypothetical protein n=1 Tax=Synechococcus sp. CBW1002 TaxID=1353134 RepID=UPI0018CEE60D|nr:hypothetical protein [Synechococcus sp. CBW1002]QPN59714.1 hypothetical protein H8F24_17450 [Synechococcus sp. CBW1002]